MQKWQYRISTNSSEMMKLGQEGWELTAVAQQDKITWFYYKRPEMSLSHRVTMEQRQEVLKKVVDSK